MTALRPETLEREKDKLYVTDAELKICREFEITPGHLNALVESKCLPVPLEGWPREQREEVRHRYRQLGGHVYFAEMLGYIKIGFSSQLEWRMKGFETTYPYPVVLLHSIAGSRRLEEWLHERFFYLRWVGEWFWRSPEILDYIEELK